MSTRARTVLLVSLACAGCSTPPALSPSPAPTSSAAAPPPSTSARVGWSGPWGRFHSRRHDAWLQLPDGAAWKIDDHRSSWLVARHPATSTVLRFKLFREEHAVNRDRCEALARRDDPTLPIEDDAAIDRADAVLSAWDSHAFSVVTPGRVGSHAIVGRYLAWGASIRRCFALSVTTTADSAAEVGARLAELPDLTKRLSFEEPTAGPGRVPAPDR